MTIVDEKIINSQQMNVPKLNLDEVRPHIVFDAGAGKVWLNEQRIMLFSQLALGKFRREVLETIGFERTKSFFLRLGYRLGKLDADLALTSKSESTVLEQFMTGPQLHALRGMVLPELTDLTLESEQAFYAKVIWHDSYEVELTQQELGHLDSPGCWTLVGYASGYSSQVLKKEIYFQEVSCRCCGDEQCVGIGKELKDWDNGEEIKDYYSKDSLIDELNNLQSYVETLEIGLREKDDMADIVGESRPFKQALNMVTKASDSRVSVLLLGETGVGKEVMARALHRSSDRADKPFVAVNCAAIPPDLIESELFGVAKGAFTGASHSREGRFERANQGTIFLDEVVELSPRAQASLLRILQEHEFERVGDNQVRKVDVRVVAATNEDLSEAVSQGRFRADLYYRLSAFPVKIPSLRQRKEDIPLFVDFFLKKYQKMYNKKISGVSDKGMAALMSYQWPGNIRELENVVERALILTDAGGYIAVDLILGPTANTPCDEQFHIDKDGSLVDDKNAAMVKGAKDLASFALDNQMNLEELEVAILNQALERAGGKVSKAARLAGMTRPAFAYRLKKNGIDA